MSQPVTEDEVEVVIDLDANTVETRDGTHDIFNDDGELRLFSSETGWAGFIERNHGYAFIDSGRPPDDWTRELPVQPRTVETALERHVRDPDIGGEGVFQRAAAIPREDEVRTDGGDSVNEREQAIREARSCINAADEHRKRRSLDNLKVELNKAKAALDRALDTDSGLRTDGVGITDDHSIRCYDCERVVHRRHISFIEVPIENQDEPGYERVPVPLCEDCRLRRYGLSCDYCGGYHADPEGIVECARDRGHLDAAGGLLRTDGGHSVSVSYRLECLTCGAIVHGDPGDDAEADKEWHRDHHCPDAEFDYTEFENPPESERLYDCPNCGTLRGYRTVMVESSKMENAGVRRCSTCHGRVTLQ